MEDRKRKTYDEILVDHPEFENVIPRKSWEFITYSDKQTLGWLKKDWLKNLEKNIAAKRYKRFGGLKNGCWMIGRNKALIGIGAGPSFNKNKEVLKAINDIDGIKSFENRDFILIASNHMFKPLLKMGIIPDFVMVADASDVVMDQLTKDIPESGRNCILVAGLHCSPRVLKKWEKQGRDIRFYLTSSPGLKERFEELTGHDGEDVLLQQGGNVLNSAWSIGLKFLGCTVFMALGNDLSYPLFDHEDDRRKSYYADGDYSTNAKETGTGRDEAKSKRVWMGFKLSSTNVVSMNATKMYKIELEPVGTTGTLWVYKTWLEANVMANVHNPLFKYMYYNCSEGGIAGVLCKDDTPEGREDINNWYMMDDVCKRWRTRTLSDAVGEFLKAKEMLKWGIQQGVPSAINLAAKS